MNVSTYERMVLSAAMNDKAAMYALVRELADSSFNFGPGDIVSNAHKLVYRTMLAMHQEGIPIDTGTLAKRLGRDLEYVGGEAYLAMVSRTLHDMGIESIEGLKVWVSVVDGSGRLRHLKRVMDEYQEVLEDVDRALSTIEDVDQFFAKLLEKISGASKVLSQYKSIAEAADRFRGTLDAEMGGQAVSWLPIGWKSTQKYRILPRSSLVTIMGLPSAGKSQLLAEFMLGAAIQLRRFDLPGVCVLNTYEMKGDKYVGRMASCLSGVNLLSESLQDNASSDYHKLMEAVDFIETLPILWDEGDMSSNQIINQCLALAAETGAVHVVGVDYAELLPDSGASEELRISGIFRNSQSLSRLLDASVCVLSQVSGEAFSNESRIAGPWGVRYSKAGWAASELELELYNPPQMRHKGVTFRVPDYITDDTKAWILVHKNKHGPTGHFALEWTPGIVRFSDPALAGFGMSGLFENIETVWRGGDW